MVVGLPWLRLAVKFFARAETLGLQLLFSTPPNLAEQTNRLLFTRCCFRPTPSTCATLPSGAVFQFVRGRQARARPKISLLSHGSSLGGRNGESDWSFSVLRKLKLTLKAYAKSLR